MSYAATYHAVRQLMPANPRRAIFYCPRSHAYFAPRGRYGRLAPTPSPLLADAPDLDRLAAALAGAGLRLKAWVIGCHNSDLATAHPDCAVRTALGDPLPHHLCPANPEVQQYLETLLCDLTAGRDLDALELESFGYGGFEHGAHHEMSGLPTDPFHSQLLSLCFCPACDPPDGLRTAVAAELRAWLATPAWALAQRPADAAEARAAFAAAHPELEVLQAQRKRTVRELCVRLRQAVRAVAPQTRLIDLGGGAAGADPDLRAWADGLVTRADPVAVTAARATLGPQADIGAGCYPLAPRPLAPEQLRAAVLACAAAGADTFNYYNHGLMQASTWGDIAEAVAACP